MSYQAVFITGTSSGIGFAVAKKAALKGYRVFAGVRNHDDALKLEQLSSSITAIIVDITDLDQVKRAAESVGNALSEDEELFAIVNNAGIILPGTIETVLNSDLKELFNINVIGQVNIIQEFLPLLRESKGRIINITSIAGEVSVPALSLYSATKAAMNSITQGLHFELTKWGITAIAIEPQLVNTPGWKKFKNKLDELTLDENGLAKNLYSNEFKILDLTYKYRKFITIKPEKVANTVMKALESAHPKNKYQVGIGAKLLYFFKKEITPFHLLLTTILIILLIFKRKKR